MGWLPVLGLAGALFLAPAAALAHANLVRSEPASSANLDQAPRQVQLWFSEKPEPKLSEIQVFNQQRQQVEAGAAHVAPDDPQSLVESLKPGLPNGVYTVNWRTTSAIDGHVTGGAFAFGVGVQPSAAEVAAAPLQQPAGANWLSGLIRWANYLAAVSLLGLVLFVLLVVDGAGGWLEEGQRRLVRLGQALAALLLAAAIAMVLEQASESSGGQLSLDGLRAMLATTVGRILLARLALGAALLAAALPGPGALAPKPGRTHGSLAAAAQAVRAQSAALGFERAAILAALLADLLLFAMSSHAQTVANAPELALLVDWLHLTTAGVWVGGLVALAVCVIPELGSRAAPAAALEPLDVERNRAFGPLVASFSQVALVSAIGLAVTGFYQALVHIGSLDDALSSDYGRAVLVKTSLFAAALLMAAFHRWNLVPAVGEPARAAATRARRFFSRTLPVEAALAVLALGAAGLLMTLSPANNLEASGVAQTKTLGDTRVTLQVVPLRVGPNQFEIDLSAHGKPVDDAQKVELQLTMLDMDMGQSALDLQPKGKGVYAAQSDLLSMGGRWQVELLLRLPGHFDQRATFDLTAKP
jgi:copper transport protein